MKTGSIAFMLILTSYSPIAFAQVKNTEHTIRLSEGAKSPAAKIEDFQWLTGYWVGKGFGGVGEEMWSQPMANVMMGTFRLISNDKLSFSEIIMLSVTDEGVSMKLKHFDAALNGWEDKDKQIEFKLVKLEETAAWFEGLTYQLDEAGVLTVYVSMKQDDGTMKEGKFTFQRTRLRE